ncbi:hypothetical protein [Streptomyces sp. NPDC057301]|uniref:hypothetical protein n=1 Tax=Streptomyces sp. NPDC057301 TaxID=3346093 RepID=UPI00363564E9
MRRTRVAAVCGAAVMAAVGGMSVAPAAGAVSAPEAGLAFHGSAAMSGGRVAVRFTPYRLGTGAVPDATALVRLRLSEALADRQALPERCARAGERIVMCRVGALDADGVGEPVGLRVRLRGAPSEVLVEFATVRAGGAAGADRGNDQQRVLVLDTGDSYHF